MTSTEVGQTGGDVASSLTGSSARPKRYRQIGLSTLLLATACAAVWYSVWLTLHDVAVVKEQLSVGRPLMRELVLKDRDHLSAVAQDQLMYDEYAWQVFVPGDGYQLQIATTGIERQVSSNVVTSLPTSEDSVKLSPGQHLIQLETYQQGDQWSIEVHVDLEQVILVKRPNQWNVSSGSLGGSMVDQQVDHPADSNLTLFRRVYTQKNPPSGGPMVPNDDGNGVQLWITAP